MNIEKVEQINKFIVEKSGNIPKTKSDIPHEKQHSSDKKQDY